MKRMLIIGLCFIMCCGICACGNASTKKEEEVVSANRQEIEVSSKQNKPQGRSEHVVLSFNAVEGAVIYDQSFDSYGYPNCCYFHKKCEACGYVSNNNGSTRSNLTTSYHCTKCGNNQHVKIVANSDWVTVYD